MLNQVLSSLIPFLTVMLLQKLGGMYYYIIMFYYYYNFREIIMGFLNYFTSQSKDREDKQKAIVGKFFAKEKETRETTRATKAKFEAMSSESAMSSSSMQMQQTTSSSSQVDFSKTTSVSSKTSVSKFESKSASQIEVAKQSGQERKQEALKRSVLKKIKVQDDQYGLALF